MVAIAGSVALITGGASGMGKAMAREFAGRGADVIVLDVDREGSEAAAEAIEADGESAIAIQADVSEPSNVEEAVERGVDEFGTIDVLCNNAGVFDGDLPLDEMSRDRWAGVLDVNLSGAFRLTKAALPVLLEGEDEGVVIE